MLANPIWKHKLTGAAKLSFPVHRILKPLILLVERMRIELTTFALRTRRSPS
jgi:hypothetical protein